MYGVLQPNIPFNCHLKVEGYVQFHDIRLIVDFFFSLVPADDLARSYLVPAALAQRFSSARHQETLHDQHHNQRMWFASK
jgi:hypothetical protein